MILLYKLSFELPFKEPVLIFTLILFIILFAPIILNKIKVPHLIGLIIAGAIIGPKGFNVITRDSSIELFGTVGLLYIMFLAGLEMDLMDFKKNSRKSAVFGFFTFALPMLFGGLVGYYILDFSLISSILLASMLASHTLITYPIISKLGVTQNPAVNVAVGGTIITDTLALLVLAVIARMTTGEMSNMFWVQLAISLVLFTAIVTLIFPIIARWFFKHYDDNVSQYIFVLGMVFLSAFLAIAAGMESIIGAFFAGLALNRLIPKSSPLMNRIEFVGNALFIPFFLIGVGMLVDYRAFLEDTETIIVAITITCAAVSGKFLAAWCTQKLFGYSVDQRHLIFGLSNSQAAATLAAVMVGHEIGLLNTNVLNGTILMILITCTISSFVAQKGAQNIANSNLSEDDEDDTAKEEHILIPVNKPEMVVRLINLSIILRNSKRTSSLFALNVISNSEGNNIEKEKIAKKILESAANTAAASDNQITKILRYDSNISNAINSVAKEHKITDLVLGLHEKKDLSDSFLGDLTEGILNKANSTTFIYKAYQPIATIKRHLIVIPPNADKEIGFSFWISKVWNIGKNAKSKLVFYATSETIEVINKIQQKRPIEVECHLLANWDDFLILTRDTKPNDSIIIVMSRRGMTSFNTTMNAIPSYLNKYFKEYNFILIYPIQHINELANNRINPSLDHNKLKRVQYKLKGLFGKK